MYYIIETKYVGPNQDQHVDVDKIEISTSPAITNSSHEERTEGWCGTTNDWAVYAHGEYATIEEARAAITENFGEVRDSDPSGDSFKSDDEDVVETYKPGKYAPMSSQTAADEGRIAYQSRKTPDANPYDESDWRHDEWWFGWKTEEECDQDESYDWSTDRFK